MAEIECPLRACAAMSGKQPAVVQGSFSLSYTQLDLVVSNTATRMRRAGIGEGDRVALRLPRDRRTMVLLLGLWRVGAVACPLSERWPEARLPELLLQIAARHLVMEEVPPDLPLPGTVTAHRGEDLLSRALTLEEPQREARLPLDRPMTLVFTSGTSGRPRAVLHAVGNHYYSARGANENIRLSSEDRWLMNLPLDHVSGLGILFRCLQNAAAMVLPEEGDSLARTLTQYRVTHVSMVDTQLRRAVAREEDRTALAGLTGGVILGGGPIDDGLVADARAAGIAVYPSYGLTEMSSQVTTVGPATPPHLRSSAGRVLRHRELKLSEEGEILVRGETLCLGFVEGERVRPPLEADGWYHTGDAGAWEEAHLRVQGRLDARFFSGGETICPEEIEQVILGAGGLRRAVVVPVEDAEFGHRPVAVVEGDAPLDPASLEAHARARLPGFKVPVAWLVWPTEIEGLKADRAALTEYVRRQRAAPGDGD